MAKNNLTNSFDAKLWRALDWIQASTDIGTQGQLYTIGHDVAIEAIKEAISTHIIGSNSVGFSLTREDHSGAKYHDELREVQREALYGKKEK